MLRLSFRPRGRRAPAIARLTLALLAPAVIAGCGGGNASTAGHDSPQAAARGFFDALGAFDGTTTGLNSILDWVPPSRREGSAQDFSALIAGATRVRFRLDNLSVGGVTQNGDTATVSVQGRLEICASGTVAGGTQTFDSCQPAPITPGGTFDQVTCVREQGQWYVADYTSASGGASSSTAAGPSASASATPTVAPPTPDTSGVVPPTPDTVSTSTST